MNDLSGILFSLILLLFQAVLALRFVCICLGFRQHVRHRTALSAAFAAGLLCVLALSAKFPLFPGITICSSSLYLLAVSLGFLEGTLPEKLTAALLPGLFTAAGELLGQGFFLLLGTSAPVPTALLANGILFILYCCAKSVFTQKPSLLGTGERVYLQIQLGCSAALFLLLYYANAFSQSRAVRLLLCAGVLGLIMWNLLSRRLLIRLHQAVRKDWEARLLKQDKNHQLRMDELKYQYEALQKVQHDFKNTLSVLKNLNAERKKTEIDTYIDAYLEASHTSAALVISENPYANAIINAKAQEARSLGIEVKIVITSAMATGHSVDICNVLGNLFDNAIAACLKAAQNRRISLNIYDNGDETVFCMKNSIAHSVLEYNPDLSTDKPDKEKHGYGTRIIREIAAKHKGYADFYEEGDEFCCNVVMYL